MRLLITGAAGKIGSELAEELSDLDPLLLDIAVPGDAGDRWIAADLAHAGDWTERFAGLDAVVHLAANADETAAWREVHGPNVEGAWNVTQAAAEHGVGRVVFASSNWAVKAEERARRPDVYTDPVRRLGPGVPPRPVNAYGLSKAFAETAGRMLVDTERIETFVAVRIGSYSPEPIRTERGRRLWLGARDLRSLFRRCLEADIRGFHVVYGVSSVPEQPYDLTPQERLLGWTPVQTIP